MPDSLHEAELADDRELHLSSSAPSPRFSPPAGERPFLTPSPQRWHPPRRNNAASGRCTPLARARPEAAVPPRAAPSPGERRRRGGAGAAEGSEAWPPSKGGLKPASPVGPAEASH